MQFSYIHSDKRRRLHFDFVLDLLNAILGPCYPIRVLIRLRCTDLQLLLPQSRRYVPSCTCTMWYKYFVAMHDVTVINWYDLKSKGFRCELFVLLVWMWGIWEKICNICSGITALLALTLTQNTNINYTKWSDWKKRAHVFTKLRWWWCTNLHLHRFIYRVCYLMTLVMGLHNTIMNTIKLSNWNARRSSCSNLNAWKIRSNAAVYNTAWTIWFHGGIVQA